MVNAQLGLAQMGLLALGRPFLLAGGPAPTVKSPTAATVAASNQRAVALANSGVRAAALSDSGVRQAEVT